MEYPDLKPVEKVAVVEKVETTTVKIQNIIRTVKNSLEAQKKINTEFDLNLTLPEIKKLEVGIKGGLPFDIAPHLMRDVFKKLKTKTTVVDDLGLGAAFDVSMDDIKDSMTMLGRTKEFIGQSRRQVQEMIHNIEFASNYTYAYSDS